MPNIPTTSWDEGTPPGSEARSNGDNRIRELKTQLREVLAVEHDFASSGQSVEGGIHLAGSARAYYQSAEPTLRPDAVTSLDSNDAGRLFVDSDDNNLYIWNGLSFVQPIASNPFSVGMIMLWSGNIATVPSGWQLCDGTNGTPDLRDKMVIGARQDDGGVAKTNVTGSLTQSGGSSTKNLSHLHTTGNHALTQAEIPAHAHNVEGYSGGGSGAYQPLFSTVSDGDPRTDPTSSVGSGNNHNHGNTGTSGSATQDVLNPYYALAYIMKL